MDFNEYAKELARKAVEGTIPFGVALRQAQQVGRETVFRIAYAELMSDWI